MKGGRGSALYLVIAVMAIVAGAACWLLQTALSEQQTKGINLLNAQLDLALAAAEAVVQDEILHGTWSGRETLLVRGVEISATETGRTDAAFQIRLVAAIRRGSYVYRHAEQMEVSLQQGTVLDRLPIAAP